MTREDIEAAWLRYMHRADLAADLATVWVMAGAKATERGMFADPDLDELVADYPRVVLHGGLCYLHELAQDDEGLGREQALFDGAAADWHFRRSIDAGSADFLTRGG